MLTEKDMSKLATGNPDWLPIVSRAWELTEGAFVVGEVLRSSDRQAELFRDGKTKTMNSRHLTGDAVDLFAVLPSGAITWVENRYIPIGKAMKQAATEHGKSITWGALKKYGGDFRTFNDMVHFEF